MASLDSTKILRTIYVSSSTGNNSNVGDESHPLKDISAITGDSKINSRILLRRGDIFFDRIYGLKNCIVEAYGVGENPVICGFKILKETSSWEKIGLDTWRLDLSDNELFLGFKEDKYSNAIAGGNIGFIYVPTNDLIIGNMLSSKLNLKRDGDFFISGTNNRDSINNQSFKYLVLHRKRSPEDLGNICLSTGEHGMQNLYNTICRYLSVVGFGKHGCVTIQGCTIENCKFDLIGGSLLIGYHKWSRYGNGIEISASGRPCCHNMVKHCQFSRIYDSAMTILTACREDETAQEAGGHGLFTELLCNALNGGAADFSGNITMGGVYAYIDRSFGAWEQRPVFKTNVTEFAPLKKVDPQVPLTVIRQLTSLFADPSKDFPLDPSFEDTNDPSVKHEYVEPYADKDNVNKFKMLQKLQSIGFVKPVDAQFMYAAMENKACRLTELGRYYWKLVNDGRI